MPAFTSIALGAGAAASLAGTGMGIAQSVAGQDPPRAGLGDDQGNVFSSGGAFGVDQDLQGGPIAQQQPIQPYTYMNPFGQYHG